VRPEDDPGVEKEAETTTMKPYTCTEYREEMGLVGLRRRLADPALDPREKEELEKEIKKLEVEMGME
jgi:hypothetical protein